jgi:hypothetical protein
VYKVKVLVTVAEARQSGCLRVFYQGVVMTHEAEFKVVRVVWSIKFL